VSKPGAFIISLDFELHWGVFDHTPLDERSRAYFLRTRQLIVPTLQLFGDHGIRATWATVGMLFARDRNELESYLPVSRPAYDNPNLDPYRLLHTLGEDEEEDPYHYAPSLIAEIANTPGQTIGSHTFAHYYCLEPQRETGALVADLGAARKIAAAYGYPPSTALVFPRNQYRDDLATVAENCGFASYRGNPTQWFWKSRSGKDTTLAQRAARLSDNYLPLWGGTSFSVADTVGRGIRNVPASRFFRPYIKKIDCFGGQRLKIRRLLTEMTLAAQGGQHYHLWWHPHNLATDPNRNMAALAEILTHYRHLNEQYGWQSHSMESFTEYLNTAS